MDKILVADLPSMDARYSAAFTGWPLVFVRSMEEASAALEVPHYDAIAIGVYFDDSQMFDLVRAIRSHEVHNEVPVLCVRGGPGFAAVTTRTLEIAVQALSADCFVDLLQFQDEKSADAALRAALQRYVKA
jgi:DNA-binding response OmpR family regulator